MRRNYFDPSTARVLQRMPTVTPLRVRLARAAVWLGTVACVVVMALGVIMLNLNLYQLGDKLDNAFMQGMQAGHQMCPRGAGA